MLAVHAAGRGAEELRGDQLAPRPVLRLPDLSDERDRWRSFAGARPSRWIAGGRGVAADELGPEAALERAHGPTDEDGGTRHRRSVTTTAVDARGAGPDPQVPDGPNWTICGDLV